MSGMELRNKQQIFEQVLISYFLDEFKFLVNVAAGREKRRNDFTDKLINVFSHIIETITGIAAISSLFVVGPAGTALGTIGNNFLTLPLKLADKRHDSKQIKEIGAITAV